MYDAPATLERPAAHDAMREPGIFKGCSEPQGPLTAATKDAILAYLGKPNATAWERLRHRAIAGHTTLAEAWAFSGGSASGRRYPSAAELIRAMRLAAARRLPTPGPRPH